MVKAEFGAYTTLYILIDMETMDKYVCTTADEAEDYQYKHEKETGVKLRLDGHSMWNGIRAEPIPTNGACKPFATTVRI